MARVDPEDDSIERMVVFHYRFDHSRGQRRQVAVAAFDNEEEFMNELERLGAELDEHKRIGIAEDVEWISGFTKEPGYRERMRRMRRGVG